MIKQRTEQIETRTAKFWFDNNGILHVEHLAAPDRGISDIEENISAIIDLWQGTPLRVLADIRAVYTTTREERHLYTNNEVIKNQIGVIALLVSSPISRVIGSMLLGINMLPMPAKLFTSEKDALEWLKGFRE